MKHTVIRIAAALLAFLAVFFLFNNYIYNEKQGTGANPEPYRATLSGEFVCLEATGNSEVEDECRPGLVTEVGEQYAVDFALMSQTHSTFTPGETLTASGVITGVERLSSTWWQSYGIEGIFSVTSIEERNGEPITYACDGDGKICPDGSLVGREGPNCEFANCPAADAASSSVTTFLGGSATALLVTVSPQEVVSDSRCPNGVTCVWEGTVEVRTVLSTQVAHGEHVMTINTPQTFGDYEVTLREVTPEMEQSGIADSSYRFTYDIEKVR